MDRAQAEFVGGVRKHIHDHIVGRFDPRYAMTSTGWETRRTLSVAALIDAMEDRLFEPGTLRAKAPVGTPMGAQLRGARMFDPRGGPAEQEQTLSHADEEQLKDLAALMRGIAGESKAWIGSFLSSDRETLTADEKGRLKTALDWLKVAEAAFKSIPLQIDHIRRRRRGGGSIEGLSPAERQLLSAYVIDEETDEPTEKLIDDGDVFNDFKSGLGALRQAWFKLAMAMIYAPKDERPPEPQLAAAFAQDGLKYEMGEVVALPPATPNRRSTPNHHAFGWPMASMEPGGHL